MSNFTDLALPVVGAGIGLAATGGNPAGAMLGMSLGSAGASALSMGQDVPTIPGASASQQQLLGVQEQNIEKQMAQTGLSAEEVNRIAQLGVETTRQTLANIRAIPTAMPLLAQQRLGKALLEQTRKTAAMAEKKVAMLDPLAEAERIKATSMMTAQASQQANQIRQAEMQKELHKQQLEQNKAKNFTEALKSAGMSAIAFSEYMKDNPTEDPDMKLSDEDLADLEYASNLDPNRYSTATDDEVWNTALDDEILYGDDDFSDEALADSLNDYKWRT